MQTAMSPEREAVTDLLLEGESPETIFLDGFDAAILGVTWEDGAGRVIYSRSKCIEMLTTGDEMSDEDAEDYFEYNTQRAVDYLRMSASRNYAPIIVQDLLS
jgi:hypothetical protein